MSFVRRKTLYSLASLAVSLLLILLLTHPDTAADAARKALVFSAGSVVPALFAASVAATMLTELGIPHAVTRLLPVHRLAGLPECAAPAVLCGLVCGFPVGAMSAAALYENGRITRGEAARLCAMTSNVSAAFLIGAVGWMFGSRALGVLLWAAQSAAAVLSGALLRPIPENETVRADDGPPIKLRFARVFCGAVAKSALACVTVSGYITFFCVLGAILSDMFPPAGGVLSLTLEFSSGAAYSAGIGSTAACGFTVGFGGISALMQACSYAGDAGIPMFPTLAAKASSAVILSAVGYAARGMAHPIQAYAPAFSPAMLTPPAAAALLGIAAAILMKKYFSRGS